MSSPVQPSTPPNKNHHDGDPAEPASWGNRLAQVWSSIRWYTRELMGDSAYEKYLDHQKLHHPERDVMSEKQFWKAHYAYQDANPGARCC